MDVLKEIGLRGIVPVIALNRAEDAVPLAKALCAGGLPVAEVTFRTAAAEDSIRAISRELPGMILGAGTVLTVEQAERAAAAGAKFIVCPGFNPTVVDYCIAHHIPVTPGVNSPSQVEQGLERGLKVLKFFPAEASGGTAMLKALAGPYKNVKFIPTGGVNPDNMSDYLKLANVHAVGGSWMVKNDLIAAGAFDKIEAMVRDAVMKLHGFKMVHIGVNAPNPDEAMKAAQAFAALFGFAIDDRGAKSVFASPEVEIMKNPGRGAKGHIAIACRNVDRAVAYLEGKGVKMVPDTAKTNPDGSLKFIYMDLDFCGFAPHLTEYK